MIHQRTLQVATWVLLRLTPASEREPVVGDLTEEYALRANLTTSSEALQWYLQQVCLSALVLLWARLRRAAWISTVGAAFLAYTAVGVVGSIVNRVISTSPAAGTPAYELLDLLIPFPTVVLIAYFAAGYRPRAAMVLGAMMLLTVTVMTLTSSERMPAWYRITYFFIGPAAVFIGSTLRFMMRRDR